MGLSELFCVREGYDESKTKSALVDPCCPLERLSTYFVQYIILPSPLPELIRLWQFCNVHFHGFNIMLTHYDGHIFPLGSQSILDATC